MSSTFMLTPAAVVPSSRLSDIVRLWISSEYGLNLSRFRQDEVTISARSIYVNFFIIISEFKTAGETIVEGRGEYCADSCRH